MRGLASVHRLPHAVTAWALPPIRHVASRWGCRPAPGGMRIYRTRRATHAVAPPPQRPCAAVRTHVYGSASGGSGVGRACVVMDRDPQGEQCYQALCVMCASVFRRLETADELLRETPLPGLHKLHKNALVYCVSVLHELGENDPMHTELLGAPPPPRNSPKGENKRVAGAERSSEALASFRDSLQPQSAAWVAKLN